MQLQTAQVEPTEPATGSMLPGRMRASVSTPRAGGFGDLMVRQLLSGGPAAVLSGSIPVTGSWSAEKRSAESPAREVKLVFPPKPGVQANPGDENDLAADSDADAATSALAADASSVQSSGLTRPAMPNPGPIVTASAAQQESPPPGCAEWVPMAASAASLARGSAAQERQLSPVRSRPDKPAIGAQKILPASHGRVVQQNKADSFKAASLSDSGTAPLTARAAASPSPLAPNPPQPARAADLHVGEAPLQFPAHSDSGTESAGGTSTLRQVILAESPRQLSMTPANLDEPASHGKSGHSEAGNATQHPLLAPGNPDARSYSNPISHLVPGSSPSEPPSASLWVSSPAEAAPPPHSSHAPSPVMPHAPQGSTTSPFEQMDALRPPQILHSTPQRLAVGLHEPALGWVEVRARASGGEISATVASPAHAALSANLPAIREYLAGQHVRVDHLAAETWSGPSGGDHHPSSGGDRGGTGGDNVPELAIAVSQAPTAEPEADSLSYISIRV